MTGAQAATWRVQPGQSLQAAIDAAAAGDTIEIARGHYIGNFTVARPLVLRGIARPTLSGALRGDTLRIGAPDVTVEGLIVRDSGDSLKDQNAGIYIQPGAHRAVVRHCELTYNLF
ncbi:MAG: nitrous oxide reductase family maturation protein NosD, partial [Cupriavidus sp.]|nr:nitrous oxide reductase family maturation protein NosD [Cupriavidus sp.]